MKGGSGDHPARPPGIALYLGTPGAQLVTPRWQMWFHSAPVVFLLVLLAVVVCSGSASAGPPGATVVLSGRSGFDGSLARGVRWSEGGSSPGWELDHEGLARGEGQLTTAVIELPLPVVEVVASWNAFTPPGAKLRIELRASAREDLWTPWFSMAVWPNGQGTPGLRKHLSGRVNEDTLVLTEPARRFQLRVTLYPNENGHSPRLRLLALAGSTPLRQPPPEELATVAFTDGETSRPPAWGKSLPVPFRSQRWEDPSISGRICGPTSLAMILEYYGQSLPTERVAALAYDQLNGIYGNWPFLAAVAAEAGLESYVTRFTDWSGIEAEILAGHPAILSVRFGPGELPGAPISASSGHLLVVAGFTETGDVLVNDPAAWTEETGRIVYDRQALLSAWANGVAILVHGPSPADRSATGPPGTP